MSKTVFVNGGAGFIGHHLCIELSKMGFNVFAIDNMQQLKFSSENSFYSKFVDERLEALKNTGVEILELDTRSKSYLDLLNEFLGLEIIKSIVKPNQLWYYCSNETFIFLSLKL